MRGLVVPGFNVPSLSILSDILALEEASFASSHSNLNFWESPFPLGLRTLFEITSYFLVNEYGRSYDVMPMCGRGEFQYFQLLDKLRSVSGSDWQRKV